MTAADGQTGAAPDALVIEGGLLLSPRACSLLARALQQLVRHTERLDGGGQLPRELLIVMAQAQRTAALTSSDVDVRTSVPAEGAPAESSHDHHDLLDAAAAGVLLGCKAANVRDLRKRGALDGRQLGHRWFFDRIDVLSLADARRRRGRVAA